MPRAEDEIRDMERRRLAAFVAVDMAVLDALHADDFSLINPAGRRLTREEYLGGVSAGFIDYQSWEPDSEIQVRAYGDAAIIRYAAQMVIALRGQVQPMRRHWHTDLYEKRDGKWQVVWSQATGMDAS